MRFLVCSLMHYRWKQMSLYSAISLPFSGCSLDMFVFDQLNTDILILNSYERMKDLLWCPEHLKCEIMVSFKHF